MARRTAGGESGVSFAGGEVQLLQAAECAVVVVFFGGGGNDAGISGRGDSSVLAGRFAADVGLRNERAADQPVLLFPSGILAGIVSAATAAGRQVIFHHGFRNFEAFPGFGNGGFTVVFAGAAGWGGGICGQYDIWSSANRGKRRGRGPLSIFLSNRTAVLGRGSNSTAEGGVFLPEAEGVVECVFVRAQCPAGGTSRGF